MRDGRKWKTIPVIIFSNAFDTVPPYYEMPDSVHVLPPLFNQYPPLALRQIRQHVDDYYERIFADYRSLGLLVWFASRTGTSRRGRTLVGARRIVREISMNVRDHSPYPHTFYFGYANGWLGYLPTRQAFAEGGYETQTNPFTDQVENNLTNVDRLSAGPWPLAGGKDEHQLARV